MVRQEQLRGPGCCLPGSVVSGCPRVLMQPQAGASDSWNDDRLPLARRSQFQLPSGHCQPMREAASRATRSSSASPRRQQTATALPS